MPATSLELEVHLLGHTLGAWCERCNLSSGVVFRTAIVSASTLRILDTGDRVVCQDCGVVRPAFPTDPRLP